MATQTKIWTDVDFNRDGKQVGWLNLPHSVTRSAYGMLAIPITVIRNGDGPTALFMAGNHGDEYEGQIGICKLIRTLQPEAIKGRVILLPAINLPAALAGTRVSPIDAVNLNRAFPGEPAGTATRQIAYYADSELFPISDIVVDLHSGGSSLDYMPFASIHESPDAEVNRRGKDALMAFGAPLSLIWQTTPDYSYASHACMRHGMPYIGGEYGGCGRVSRQGVGIVERGLARLLVHMGITAPDTAPAPEPIRLVEFPGRDFFVYAPEGGLFEPATDLGDVVRAGDVCGHVHFVDDPGRTPVACHFKADGFVVCKRHFGRVERGDCVAHLARDVQVT